MTDKKSFLSADKNLGKNDEITEVLDKFAQSLDYKDFKNWKAFRDTNDSLSSVRSKDLATLAFEQGKLAGKKELVDNLRSYEFVRAMSRHSGISMDNIKQVGEALNKEFERLKSQLKGKEEAKK